jgi:hypothetical protein
MTTVAQLNKLAQKYNIPLYLLSDDLLECNLKDIEEVLNFNNR